MSDKADDVDVDGKAEVSNGARRRKVSSVRFSDSVQFISPPEPSDMETQAEVSTAEGQLTPQMEHLRDYLAVCMGIRTPPKVLDEVSFEGVARYIASGKVHNIITMVGAGISTSAGIPDFRSPDVGLYAKLKKEYKVSDPAALFTSQYFMKDPKPFYERAHLFFQDDYKPTPCHYFIRMLHEKGLLLRHYTQNIDTLDRMAGIPDEKVIEAHGSWAVSYCLECCEDYSYDWMKEKVRSGKGIVKCDVEGCSGTIKPEIVLFGESLPWRLMDCAGEDFRNCDLLIIMGTSLTVQPFASLTHKVPIGTPRLYINKEKGDVCKKHPMSALLFGGSFDFDEENNTRDVFKGTDCDSGCLEMADLLGWGDELRELVKTEHARLDEHYASQARSRRTPCTSSSKAGASPRSRKASSAVDPSPATSAQSGSRPPARKDSQAADTDGRRTSTASKTGTKPRAASITKPKPNPGGAQSAKSKPSPRSSSSKTSASPRTSISSTKK